MANPFWPSLLASLGCGLLFLIFTRAGVSKYGSAGQASWRFAFWWAGGSTITVFVFCVFFKFHSS